MRRFLALLCLLAAPSLFAQADQQLVSVDDSADPVVPGTNVVYTVVVRNHGPDPAVNGGVNLNFPSMTYVSAVAPAGFTCAVFGQVASCTNPAFAPGDATFIVTLQMPPHLISFADGTVTNSFSTSGVTPDPINGNNSMNETTSWDSPQTDLAVTAADSPDPITPDNDITYTVDLVNNGPDTATSVSFSTFNDNSLRFQSAVVPAGWNCTLPAVDGNPTFACTKPSMAGSETAQFLIVVRAYGAVLGALDGSVDMSFTLNGTGQETASPNNSDVETTQYVTPDADMQITGSDSPDPVFPDGDITYTVTVTNGGPDTATNAILNVPMNNMLRFQSVTAPAGWSCSPPAVGGGTSWSCTNPSFAMGSSMFTIVLRANDEQFGITDQNIHQAFTTGSSVADPVGANNNVTVTTQYITPDADLQIAASDSPDPVGPDGDITYTVTVTNAGPDAAPNAILNIPMNNTLRFQSVIAPAGWSCSPPAVGGGTSWSCTNASFALGTSVFTIVLRANDEQFGINDQTIQQAFTIGSSVADPNANNNAVTVSTQYSTPDANLVINASDAPDPVVNGSNLTYTVTVENFGPDVAPNAQMNASLHPSLTFQSIVVPAGWNCTTPDVDTTGLVTCTNPSMAVTGTFTIVAKLVTAGAGGTISSVFTASSDIQDPVPLSNSVEVFTNWIDHTSDLSIFKSNNDPTVQQGGTLVFTISMYNNGPSDASNVTMTDNLPPGLLFQSILGPGGWVCTTPPVGTSGPISCTIASFPVGGPMNLTLFTTVAPNATGLITNTASIGFNGVDPNPGNSSGVAGGILVGGTADLVVTKSTATTSVAPGGTISYTIDVNNAGPEPAASVTMTDILPPSLLFQSIAAPAGWSCTTPAVGTNGTVNCTTASLAVGPAATFTLATTVAPSATGTVANTASATHSSFDPNPGNSSGTSGSTTIVTPASANLGVTKSTATTSVTPGQTFSYTISFTNAGPDAATNAVLSDTLPASLLFQSITVPGGFNCTTPAVGATGTITCTAATLPSGAAALFTLQVQVATGATGTITNTATVSSATGDATPANNTSTTSPIPVAPGGGPGPGLGAGTNIPTLSEWALIGLALLLAGIAMRSVSS